MKLNIEVPTFNQIACIIGIFCFAVKADITTMMIFVVSLQLCKRSGKFYQIG
jgi:hypothetical protein